MSKIRGRVGIAVATVIALGSVGAAVAVAQQRADEQVVVSSVPSDQDAERSEFSKTAQELDEIAAQAAAVKAAAEAQAAVDAVAAQAAAEAQSAADATAAQAEADARAAADVEANEEPDPEPSDDGVPAGAWPLPWIASADPQNAQGGNWDFSGCGTGASTFNGVPYCVP
jgi:hypothetical protein